MVRSVMNVVRDEMEKSSGSGVVGRRGKAQCVAGPPPSPTSFLGGEYSNTPSKCLDEVTGEVPRIVHFGLDTMRVGFDIQWASISLPLLRKELNRCQCEAKNSPNGVAVVMLGNFGLVDFYANSARSMRAYQYRFRCGNAMFFLSVKAGGSDVGNGFVQYGAEFCCQDEMPQRHEDLLNRLEWLCGTVGRRKEWLNRVDVACDVLMPSRVNFLPLVECRVPSRASFNVMGSARDGHTLYLGKRNSRISLAVYEKGMLVKSGVNSWFRALWELGDDEEIENVYRLEYRFNRDFLREHWGKGSVLLVAHCLPDLFQLGLGRLRAGTRSSKARESEPHTLFLAASGAAGDDAHTMIFRKVRPADVIEQNVEDFLLGRFRKMIDKYRVIACLDSSAEIGDVLNHILGSIEGSKRASAGYGVSAPCAPF